MKIFSKEGQTMVDVTRVYPENGNIVMVCKLMGAYSMKIYLKPEELRSAISLVNWDLIKELPGMLVRGTAGEEKLCEIGHNLCRLGPDAMKIIFGEKGESRLASAAGELGMTTLGTVVDSGLLLLQILLQDKKPAKK